MADKDDCPGAEFISRHGKVLEEVVKEREFEKAKEIEKKELWERRKWQGGFVLMCAAIWKIIPDEIKEAVAKWLL